MNIKVELELPEQLVKQLTKEATKSGVGLNIFLKRRIIEDFGYSKLNK